MSEVKIVERGWPGHFICASRCIFRRNTLVSGPGGRVVVSTVGDHRDPRTAEMDSIGVGDGGGVRIERYYETMVFDAVKKGPYWDSGDERHEHHGKWAICAESAEALPDDVDNRADRMHNRTVRRYAKLLAKKRRSGCPKKA